MQYTQRVMLKQLYDVVLLISLKHFEFSHFVFLSGIIDVSLLPLLLYMSVL